MESKKILILGASGFIGNAIYKELCSYFDTYGTYFTKTKEFQNNHQFIPYNLEEDDVYAILEQVKPYLIISALRGNFEAQIIAHQHIAQYIMEYHSKLYFISSANVFDAYSKYPSYEHDKTLSESIYGRFKIKIENLLLRLPKEKSCILRLPMVFGNKSPRIREIKTALAQKEPIEVFPNLVVNVTNDDALTQQIHYLINRNKSGIYHLGSSDLVHHEDFIKEVVKRIGTYQQVIYKQVYTTNEERYLAVLPKEQQLPKNLQISYQQIIDHHVSG
ncbi:sugar nucleotide-binding protein [Arenibacter sp. GZD96]|uniref:sugar nucleotide-binding protein n=1 Tax=Aurantibrevibacter litoralis TaxID=3106030 RepID=UPI002B002FC1|nr:sugar nucleotide-binding protein [Arenibacter sp. GZD-96]MEA1784898.1 sugar nucleotide-binding protein [Arenibacter sp. GZD-96]